VPTGCDFIAPARSRLSLRAAATALALALCSQSLGAEPTKSLNECVAIAIEHHPSLKSATATIEAGQQRVWQAASNYLPQVNAAYSASRRNSSLSSATGVGGGTTVGRTTNTFNFYNTGVNFSQVLFDFGQTLASIRAAEAQVQSLEADRTTQEATVVLNVKQAYYSLLAAQHLETVADEAVRQTQEHLRDAEARFRVGLAAKFDVTNQQVQAANAELNQVTARNNVAVARETLRNALGLDEPLNFGVVDSFEVPAVEVTEATAVTRAYESRPELQSIRAQEQSADEQVSALERRYLPAVTGNAGYQWSGNSYPLQSTWNVGAAVNLPILTGGLTRAQVGEAKANLAKLQFDESQLRQNIALEVRQAVLDLGRAGESIRVSKTALRQARENLDLAVGRYRTGVGNILEVTDAQATHTTAEANYVQALYAYDTSLAALVKATAHDWTATP
jgi:outer membrane protein